MQIRFGDFELDSRRYRLQRDGEPIALRPKVFDLLVFLARHRERVVPREELVRMLWGGTRVGEGSLSGLVNELRAALGERGCGPSSVRTVHARGYQFVAPVEMETLPASIGASGEGQEEDAAAGVAERSGLPNPSTGGVSEGLERIQLELDRTRREGPRGLLFVLDSSATPSVLLDRAAVLAGHLGVESVRVRGGSELDTAPEPLGPCVLECLVERRGLRKLSGQARAEISELLRPRPRESGEARRWDAALRRLLRRLALECPLLLILDRLERFDGDSLLWIESLIGLELESAPLLVVGTVDRKCIDASPVLEKAGPGSTSRADVNDSGALLRRLLLDSGLESFRLVGSERARLDAWCRDRGVEPLPTQLAEALLAHLASGTRRAEESAAKEGEAAPCMRTLETQPSDRHEVPSRSRMRHVRVHGIAADRRSGAAGEGDP